MEDRPKFYCVLTFLEHTCRRMELCGLAPDASRGPLGSIHESETPATGTMAVTMTHPIWVATLPVDVASSVASPSCAVCPFRRDPSGADKIGPVEVAPIPCRYPPW
jgi:hypothetical protein